VIARNAPGIPIAKRTIQTPKGKAAGSGGIVEDPKLKADDPHGLDEGFGAGAINAE
jgi:hypothetical protein